MDKKDIIDSIDFIKESVEDTIRHRAVLFHIWMRIHHATVNDAEQVILLYDDFDKEYKAMQEAKPKKEI